MQVYSAYICDATFNPTDKCFTGESAKLIMSGIREGIKNLKATKGMDGSAKKPVPDPPRDPLKPDKVMAGTDYQSRMNRMDDAKIGQR